MRDICASKYVSGPRTFSLAFVSVRVSAFSSLSHSHRISLINENKCNVERLLAKEMTLFRNSEVKLVKISLYKHLASSKVFMLTLFDQQRLVDPLDQQKFNAFGSETRGRNWNFLLAQTESLHNTCARFWKVFHKRMKIGSWRVIATRIVETQRECWLTFHRTREQFIEVNSRKKGSLPA